MSKHMLMKVVQWLILVLLAAITGGLVYLSTLYFMDLRQPFSVVSENAVEEPVKVGEDLTITYNVRRLKDCSLSVERTIRGTDNNFEYTIVVGSREVTKTPKDEMQEVAVIFPIPLAAPPGDYVYNSTVSAYCNIANRVLNIPYQRTTPDVPFEVIG